MVCQRHRTWHRHLAAPHPPPIRAGVRRGATRPRGDQCGAGAGAAGEAMEAGGLEGFGEGRGWENGGGPPRQQRLARPRGACHTVVMIPL
jgi:hypothetical protein